MHQDLANIWGVRCSMTPRAFLHQTLLSSRRRGKWPGGVNLRRAVATFTHRLRFVVRVQSRVKTLGLLLPPRSRRTPFDSLSRSQYLLLPYHVTQVLRTSAMPMLFIILHRILQSTLSSSCCLNDGNGFNKFRFKPRKGSGKPSKNMWVAFFKSCPNPSHQCSTNHSAKSIPMFKTDIFDNF